MTRPVRMARHALLALAALGAATAEAALPPVLDRELFFGNPEIAAAQLSPDGQYVAFLKPWKDTRNIWVKKTRGALRRGAPASPPRRSGRSRPSSGRATAGSSSS